MLGQLPYGAKVFHIYDKFGNHAVRITTWDSEATSEFVGYRETATLRMDYGTLAASTDYTGEVVIFTPETYRVEAEVQHE